MTSFVAGIDPLHGVDVRARHPDRAVERGQDLAAEVGRDGRRSHGSRAGSIRDTRRARGSSRPRRCRTRTSRTAAGSPTPDRCRRISVRGGVDAIPTVALVLAHDPDGSRPDREPLGRVGTRRSSPTTVVRRRVDARHGVARRSSTPRSTRTPSIVSSGTLADGDRRGRPRWWRGRSATPRASPPDRNSELTTQTLPNPSGDPDRLAADRDRGDHVHRRASVGEATAWTPWRSPTGSARRRPPGPSPEHDATATTQHAAPMIPSPYAHPSPSYAPWDGRGRRRQGSASVRAPPKSADGCR